MGINIGIHTPFLSFFTPLQKYFNFLKFVIFDHTHPEPRGGDGQTNDGKSSSFSRSVECRRN